MNTLRHRQVIVAAVGILAFAAAAFAEVTVSVTITGSVDQVMPILQFIKDQGAASGTGDAQDGLKLQVHSMTAGPGEPAGSAGSAEGGAMVIPARPTLGIYDPRVEPAAARPGEIVKVLVAISDPDRQVDTVGATVSQLNNMAFDLYDNASNGDVQPADGTWSYALKIPQSAPAGQYAITIIAYDKNGAPIMTKGTDGRSRVLQTEAKFAVNR